MIGCFDLTGRMVNVMDHCVAYPKFNRNNFQAQTMTANHKTWHQLECLKYAKQEGCGVAQGGKFYLHYELTPLGVAALVEHHLNKNSNI